MVDCRKSNGRCALVDKQFVISRCALLVRHAGKETSEADRRTTQNWLAEMSMVPYWALYHGETVDDETKTALRSIAHLFPLS